MDERATTQAKVETALDEHDLMCVGVRGMARDIERAASMMTECLTTGGQLLVCGNGGSAADAQHIAAEFLGRFLKERRPLPAIALHANTSAVTAIGNDYGFDEVFSRQVLACARPGDVLLAITTSGESPNILRAAEVARDVGMHVIGMSGPNGGSLGPLCDICLAVQADKTPRIQEGHALIGHLLCEIVEDALFSEQESGGR